MLMVILNFHRTIILLRKTYDEEKEIFVEGEHALKWFPLDNGMNSSLLKRVSFYYKYNDEVLSKSIADAEQNVSPRKSRKNLDLTYRSVNDIYQPLATP